MPASSPSPARLEGDLRDGCFQLLELQARLSEIDAASRCGSELRLPARVAGALGLVGRTPCVRLERLGRAGSTDLRAEIVAKLESRNPGGSLKDRTALGMILDAEARGRLREGDRLVEATAGNTGIGLSLIARCRGYRVTIVMPERYGPEKGRLCAALGAEVVRVPGEQAGMRECLAEARRFEEQGAVLLNQFENPANPGVHELTTGPELHEQCGGAIDAIVAGIGTGGTITGVARALRARNPAVLVVGVESQGSVIGGRKPCPTRIEGIGNSFVPATLDTTLLSEVLTISDECAFRTVRELACEEGLLTGPSGGAIAAGALEIARRLGPGTRVATIIPDGSERYWSRGLFDAGA